MAKKRMLNSDFWTDDYILDLKPSEKFLFLYYITNQRSELSGIYELSPKVIEFETGLKKEFIEKTEEKFMEDGKIYRNGKWVFIRNFLKNQSPNPSMITGVTKNIDELEDSVVEWIRSLESGYFDYLGENYKKKIFHRKDVPTGLRKIILERDGNICKKCGSEEKLHIHHKIPQNKGGSDKEENLITLCSSCHLLIHKLESINYEEYLTACDSLSQPGTFKSKSKLKSKLKSKSKLKPKPVKEKQKISLSLFEEFWEEYPVKKGKGKAEDGYKKALKETTHEVLVQKVKDYKEECRIKEKNKVFCPEYKHATTWLNQKCWEDDYEVVDRLGDSYRREHEAKVKRKVEQSSSGFLDHLHLIQKQNAERSC